MFLLKVITKEKQEDAAEKAIHFKVPKSIRVQRLLEICVITHKYPDWTRLRRPDGKLITFQ